MFIIAGLLAVLGARKEAMAVLAELPFAAEAPAVLWDLKVLLLVVLFVYAFSKFTLGVPPLQLLPHPDRRSAGAR